MSEIFGCPYCQSEMLISNFENHYLNECLSELIIHQCQIQDCMQFFATLEALHEHGRHVHSDTAFFDEAYVIVSEEVANSLCSEIANFSAGTESKPETKFHENAESAFWEEIFRTNIVENFENDKNSIINGGSVTLDDIEFFTNEAHLSSIIDREVLPKIAFNIDDFFFNEKTHEPILSSVNKDENFVPITREKYEDSITRRKSTNEFSNDILSFSTSEISSSRFIEVENVVSSSREEANNELITCGKALQEINFIKSSLVDQNGPSQDDFFNEMYQAILLPDGEVEFLGPFMGEDSNFDKVKNDNFDINYPQSDCGSLSAITDLFNEVTSQPTSTKIANEKDNSSIGYDKIEDLCSLQNDYLNNLPEKSPSDLHNLKKLDEPFKKSEQVNIKEPTDVKIPTIPTRKPSKNSRKSSKTASAKTYILCEKCGRKISDSCLANHSEKCLGIKKQTTHQCSFEDCKAILSSKRSKERHENSVHKSPVKCPRENCNVLLKPAGIPRHLKLRHKEEITSCTKVLDNDENKNDEQIVQVEQIEKNTGESTNDSNSQFKIEPLNNCDDSASLDSHIMPVENYQNFDKQTNRQNIERFIDLTAENSEESCSSPPLLVQSTVARNKDEDDVNLKDDQSNENTWHQTQNKDDLGEVLKNANEFLPDDENLNFEPELLSNDEILSLDSGSLSSTSTKSCINFDNAKQVQNKTFDEKTKSVKSVCPNTSQFILRPKERNVTSASHLDVAGPSLIRCPYQSCSYGSPEPKKLETHFEEFHKMVKKQCEKCKRWITIRGFSRHHEQCENIEKRQEKPRMFVCSRKGCGALFTNQTSRQQHLDNDHPALVKCTFKNCNSIVKQNNLSQHIKAIHQRVKKQCDNCQQWIPFSGFYGHFERCVSNGEKIFQCFYDGCEAKFTTRGNRSTHINIKHKSSGKKHHEKGETSDNQCSPIIIEIVKTEKKIQCGKCEEKFATEREKMKHLRTAHSRLQEFIKCPRQNCNMQFTLANMNQHIKEVHDLPKTKETVSGLRNNLCEQEVEKPQQCESEER